MNKPANRSSALLAIQQKTTRILHGLEFLRRDNPWPDFPYGEHEPFHFALDANNHAGRELILRELDKHDVKLMIEVGCFLGGSARHWLAHKKDLTVIGVDPWDSNWAAYIESIPTDPVLARHTWHLPDGKVGEIVRQLREYGNFAVAMNNLRLYKSRFIPVRMKSPDALYYLARRQIKPDAIYLDANKAVEDIWIAHSLFPDALIWGDDWLWFDEEGNAPMQEGVASFCEVHGFKFEARQQTWVIHPRSA